MQGKTFYNEIEPYPAQWIENLITKGLVHAGTVDTRTIHAIEPQDLAPYHRAHFFAGIGGWDLALQLAGWPSDRPVWTGSCPCQPFSAAGKRQGEADPRHLWPEFKRLISLCRPPVIFGEQVASKDGRAWLAGVRADLEGMGYAVGAADLCAASVGAPHIRQRLFWVAYSERDAGESWRTADESGEGPVAATGRAHAESGRRSLLGRLGDAGRISDERRGGSGEARREPRGVEGQARQQRGGDDAGSDGWLGDATDCRPPGVGRAGQVGIAEHGGLGDSSSQGLARRSRQRSDDGPECPAPERAGGDGAVGLGHPDSRGPAPRGLAAAADGHRRTAVADGGPWARFRLLGMLDGKTRRIGSEVFPLAHGVPARVGKLRASGNAIVPYLAAEFIRAFLDAEATT